MEVVVFGTTNNRKVEDFANIVEQYNADVKILSMTDIGWDMGEIEENGLTIEENSLIKARAIWDFCRSKNLHYTIVTDDSGLFVRALNGAPGINTARFADDEIRENPTLPKYQAIYKLLDLMKDKNDKSAQYRCAVTIMKPDGTYTQVVDCSDGFIDDKINEPIKKPYFYSLFVDKLTGKPFNQLTESELSDTYRYKALAKAIELFKTTSKTKTKD